MKGIYSVDKLKFVHSITEDFNYCMSLKYIADTLITSKGRHKTIMRNFQKLTESELKDKLKQ